MLDVTLLNSSFEPIYVLDVYESFIWTDRYNEAGDFSLLNPLITDAFTAALATAKYISIAESSRIMIFEDFEYTENVKITGRSLESILDRRVVWEPLYGDGGLEDVCEVILTASVIDAKDIDRIIPNFIFDLSGNVNISGIIISVELHGESIYDVIVALCKQTDVGWKLIWKLGAFHFELYLGVDRSISQSVVPAVEFSKNLDNLITSTFIESSRPEKTVILAAGEKGIGDQYDVFPVYAAVPDNTGLLRKELFLTTGVTRTIGDIQLTELEYQLVVEIKAEQALASAVKLQSFDGEVESSMYNVGDEYNLGDIVEIADEHGHSGRSRVNEIIYASDVDGVSIYPTFIPI